MLQVFLDFKAEFYIHLNAEYGILPLRLEKFENKIFKLLIGGSTASLACSMQGAKNETHNKLFRESRRQL